MTGLAAPLHARAVTPPLAPSAHGGARTLHRHVTMIGHAVGPGVPDTAAATAARLPSPSHEPHSEPKSS